MDCETFVQELREAGDFSAVLKLLDQYLEREDQALQGLLAGMNFVWLQLAEVAKREPELFPSYYLVDLIGRIRSCETVIGSSLTFKALSSEEQSAFTWGSDEVLKELWWGTVKGGRPQLAGMTRHLLQGKEKLLA